MTAVLPSVAPRATPRSRLRATDLVGVAVVGPRTRKARSAMTAIGIAIGIAALVAVLGISASSKAQLLAELDALGTSRLEIRAGQSLTGREPQLPEAATSRIARVDGVDKVASVTTIDTSARSTHLIPETDTAGIAVRASDPELLSVTGAAVASGRFLDASPAGLPAVVLGAVAAERLGVVGVDGRMILLGDEWFAVIGILEPSELYPQLDTSALISRDVAETVFEIDQAPTAIYVVAEPDALTSVRATLAPATNPENPSEVDVSNPSDALAAKDAVDDGLTALLLALGGVALLVGGIGIANVMVIGVLERRNEIGVRRALGATKRHIRAQFVAEAIILSIGGGILGVSLGVAVTAAYSLSERSAFTVPPEAVLLGLGAAVVVGSIAGFSPANRAARMAPADAIRPA